MAESIYKNMTVVNGELVDQRNVYGMAGSEVVVEAQIKRNDGYIRNTFPQNLKSNGNKTYIKFEVVDEKPVTLGNMGSILAPLLGSAVGILDDFSESIKNSDFLSALGNMMDEYAEASPQNATLDRDMVLPVKNGAYVELYMPPGIDYNGGVEFKGMELGVGGAVAVSALQNGTNPLTAMVGSGARTLSRGLKGAANDATTNLAVNQILQNFSSDDFDTTVIKKVGNIASQVTVNPNSRQTFEGVNTRTFSFSFSMIPTTSNESRAIKDIVKFFRTQLYPESIDEAGISMGYKFPERFLIHMMCDGKQIFHRIKPSYLTSVNVKYNNGKQVFFNDPKDGDVSPYQTELSLSFTESTRLVRQDIEGNIDPDAKIFNRGY
jgi:hypothetical protein